MKISVDWNSRKGKYPKTPSIHYLKIVNIDLNYTYITKINSIYCSA